MSEGPKTTSWNKTHVENDPRVTPWREEELDQPVPKRNRGRSMRDWLVLGLAILLVIYIIGFLVVGVSQGSGNTPRGFSFGGGDIALIPIHGEISSQTSSSTIGYADVIAALEEADNDPSVSVIFLDIDSGGGSVVSSKQIVSKVREMEKPVVSWIGEVGASGAYYIASASDYVIADEDSITGSIGVISIQPNFTELLQKIGVQIETIKTGELKDIGSPFNAFTDQEKAVLQAIVEEAFESFTKDVRAFRGEKLNPVGFLEVLDGRILSGRQAKVIGLIDETGTREFAFLKAAELGKITGAPSIRTFFEREITLRELLFGAGASFGEGIVSSVNQKAETATNGVIEAK